MVNEYKGLLNFSFSLHYKFFIYLSFKFLWCKFHASIVNAVVFKAPARLSAFQSGAPSYKISKTET